MRLFIHQTHIHHPAPQRADGWGWRPVGTGSRVWLVCMFTCPLCAVCSLAVEEIISRKVLQALLKGYQISRFSAIMINLQLNLGSISTIRGKHDGYLQRGLGRLATSSLCSWQGLGESQPWAGRTEQAWLQALDLSSG